MKYARSRLARHLFAAAARPHRVDRFVLCRSFALEMLEDRRLLSAAPSYEPLDETLPAIVAGPMARTLQTYGATPSATAGPTGFTPQQIRHAYGFDLITFNGGIQGDGSGQTIAIVDAFHNPNMVSDLAAFDTAFSLAAPPSFLRVSQTGTTTLPTATNSTWALETSLDVEWAHALAPGANIILVETASADSTDLFVGIDWARKQPGVVAVSMSWGFDESLLTSELESTFDAHFVTPATNSGVTFVAASGDSGSPGIYPAMSDNVLAVGGTSLTLDTQANNYNYLSETAWGSSGGGASLFEPLPSYQVPFVPATITTRAMPDVAFDGNPSTGVAVRCSFTNGASTPWSVVGGTSFSTPAWAAVVAVVSQGRALDGLAPYDGATEFLPAIYSLPATDFHDITTGGNNGIMPAGPGYDTVTGRGTPLANLVVPGLIGSGTISGTVYTDTNNNGVFDSEPGLSGWTVYHDINNNNIFDISAPHTYNKLTSTALPDLVTNATSVLNVPLTGNILDVNVTFDITHTRGSDLVITLTSPTGVKVTLASNVVGSSGNISVTLDDAALTSIIGASGSSITGTMQPATPLAMFNNTSPNGNWTMTISDTKFQRSGTLNSWSLVIATGDPSTVSDANGGYQFQNLLGGTYKIGDVLQAPYTRAVPATGFYTISLPSVTNLSGQDFGNLLPASATPSGVTLLPASDTGAQNNDGITKLSNSLQFQVTGTVAGATVNVLADGSLIGSVVASGATTSVTSNVNLLDGTHVITATQTELSKSPSLPVSGPTIQVDTAAPAATIVAVAPSPRTTGVSQITITFAEPVTGLNLADLQLTRDGGSNLLGGGQTVATINGGLTWTLANLFGLTDVAGAYQLDVTLAGTPIVDTAGNVETATTSSTFTVVSSVAGRSLFYNNSAFDNNDAAITFSDDSAIATDKTAYLPDGSTAVFENVSSYSKGLNGIMIDLLGPGSHSSITAADFVFKAGADNAPSGWSAAPGPSSISVRTGAGVSGSDRVEIIWGANAVKNQWLEVQVLATTNTGLTAPDVFFWGNRLGDTGSPSATDFSSTVAGDGGLIVAGLGAGAGITNVRDIDRTNSITVAGDRGVTIANLGTLNRLTVGSAGPFAPVGAPAAAPQSGLQAAPQAGDATSSTTASSASVVGNPRIASGSPAPSSSGNQDDAHVAFGLSVAAHVWRGTGADGSVGELWSLVDDGLLELLAAGRRPGNLRRR